MIGIATMYVTDHVSLTSSIWRQPCDTSAWLICLQSGLTPLHVAAFMGHMSILLYLIQHGAGINTTTVRGETALHLAARANQTDVMRILLRNGALVDARARVRI